MHPLYVVVKWSDSFKEFLEMSTTSKSLEVTMLWIPFYSKYILTLDERNPEGHPIHLNLSHHSYLIIRRDCPRQFEHSSNAFFLLFYFHFLFRFRLGNSLLFFYLSRRNVYCLIRYCNGVTQYSNSNPFRWKCIHVCICCSFCVNIYGPINGKWFSRINWNVYLLCWIPGWRFLHERLSGHLYSA